MYQKQNKEVLRSLYSEGAKYIGILQRFFSPERWALISQTQSQREEALKVLGITETDLTRIEEEKTLGRREVIRRAIAHSSPSFGRFLTQAYTYYEDHKKSTAVDADNKAIILEKMKQKMSTWKPETLTADDLASINVDLYLLSKNSHNKSTR